jgi:polysaccharide deacetylase 2 family uncharacterized protein YibQ
MPQASLRAPRRARLAADRSGSAGLVATCAMAAAGLAIGAVGGYFDDWSAPAPAAARYAASLDLRDAPLAGSTQAFGARARIVERVLSGGAPERFLPPHIAADRPRIILILDDIGPDRAAFERVMGLPGPLTLSFLPYTNDAQPLADRALAKGHAIMLHLPMEPAGSADPGPRALESGMSGEEFAATLDWNLARLSGYVGVNNHMGSRLTRDEGAMKTLLAALAGRDLFFLDSLTTGQSRAGKAGAAVGAKVYARDVFIDAEESKAAMVAQLALVEDIAARTGFAVAIAHPRPATLDVIGPWLTSAPARGFRLDTVEALSRLEAAWNPARRVAAR